MTTEGIFAVVSGVAAGSAAVAAWVSIRLITRRPEIVADLLVRKGSLDLVVANIGRGVAYDIAFEATGIPSAALKQFRESSLLRHGLSVFAPGREFRVPLLSLTEEFWGDGRGFEDPLTLKVKYKHGALRRNRTRRFALRLGAFSDDVHGSARGFSAIEWGE